MDAIYFPAFWIWLALFLPNPFKIDKSNTMSNEIYQEYLLTKWIRTTCTSNNDKTAGLSQKHKFKKIPTEIIIFLFVKDLHLPELTVHAKTTKAIIQKLWQNTIWLAFARHLHPWHGNEWVMIYICTCIFVSLQAQSRRLTLRSATKINHIVIQELYS